MTRVLVTVAVDVTAPKVDPVQRAVAIVTRQGFAVRCAWCERPLGARDTNICPRCRVTDGIERVHPAPAPGSYRVIPPELEGPFGTGDAALAEGGQ